jgi:hypothetical protein
MLLYEDVFDFGKAVSLVSFSFGFELMESVSLNSRFEPEQMRENVELRKVSLALRKGFRADDTGVPQIASKKKRRSSKKRKKLKALRQRLNSVSAKRVMG